MQKGAVYMGEIKITGIEIKTTHKMSKKDAMEYVQEFGMDEELECMSKGNRRKARMIRHARKDMAVAMLQGIKKLIETMELMTEPIIIEDGPHQGKKGTDVFHYIRDDEIREMVKQFRVKYFGKEIEKRGK